MTHHEIAKQLKAYRKRHPNATVAEENAFIDSLLQKRAKGFFGFEEWRMPNVTENKAHMWR